MGSLLSVLSVGTGELLYYLSVPYISLPNKLDSVNVDFPGYFYIYVCTINVVTWKHDVDKPRHEWKIDMPEITMRNNKKL